MNKTIKIYIVFLVLLLVGIVYIDVTRPKPINWTPTYDIKDKIPFGLYVFNEEAPALFGQKVNRITETAYQYFEPKYDYDSLVNTYTIRGTILSVSDQYMIDDESTQELLYFAQHGNKIFISSKSFPQKLMDSLKFSYSSKFMGRDTIFTSLANPHLGKKKYDISVGAGNSYFEKIDTLNTTVLGYHENTKEKLVDFIKVPYGKGEFYLHTQPVVFTNYHLLKGNHSEYAAKVLSYTDGEVFWLLKNQSGEIVSGSPMRYILSQPALKAAWYIFLLGMIVFFIFNAKRKQRIVPIIKPLENTTVDFTKTIGNLYFQEGNHDNIIEKKIIYFLEKIRNDYLLDTTVLDENFEKKLQQKSGKKIEDIQKVVYLINQRRKSYHQSIESDLIALNTAIEKILAKEKNNQET
ncbi:MAG: hypothetical protein BGO88_06385 [Flavobacterium sp. 38-13]|uniref:DUF4350 domain-containing protein n=1 Tax=Flavobacterium sp. 38-13 TaxID=1896168 RepID=UPI00095AB16D|nr:DUF4350 domain-containing protein [Flavobacterium sp. 38-13]OJX53609.1 MAG: hypothetical protein BGO88_06385 [Flavobacterium sp. 38-13]